MRHVMCAVQCPVTICIPHCMPRKDMASREPTVKAELEPGKWTELPRTSDVTLEGFRVSIHGNAQSHRIIQIRYRDNVALLHGDK